MNSSMRKHVLQQAIIAERCKVFALGHAAIFTGRHAVDGMDVASHPDASAASRRSGGCNPPASGDASWQTIRIRTTDRDPARPPVEAPAQVLSRVKTADLDQWMMTGSGRLLPKVDALRIAAATHMNSIRRKHAKQDARAGRPVRATATPEVIPAAMLLLRATPRAGKAATRTGTVRAAAVVQETTAKNKPAPPGPLDGRATC